MRRLALPISLIAGLFGMNAGGIPSAKHPHGFFAVVAFVAALAERLAHFALDRTREP